MHRQSIGILGVGSCVPVAVRTNDWWPPDFVARFEERRKRDVSNPQVLLSRARSEAQRVQFRHMLETHNDPFRGTCERRVLEPEHAPSFLEIAAARKAIAHAGIDPAELDAVLSYSAPSDHASPGNTGTIQGAIGAKRAMTLGIDAGCASFLSGMAIADALITARQARLVLVVASSVQTRIADPDDAGAPNFGDGAGAVVLGPVAPGYGFEAHASRGVSAYRQAICLGPNGQRPWYEGGGPMYIRSPNLLVGHRAVAGSCDLALEAVDTVLRRAGRERRELTHWYSHQPVCWFSPACREATGLTHTKTVETFSRYAGMGAGNIGVNLDEAVARGELQPGDRLMLYACGAGFVWAATVVTWSHPG